MKFGIAVPVDKELPVNNRKQVLNRLEKLKEIAAKENLILEKDGFDIFGGISYDNKLQPLANKKHRESKKELFKVLDINKNTTIEMYVDLIKEIINNVNTAMEKIKNPINLPIYKIDKNGKVDWVKKFGTSTVDIINDVVTASNGDAIIVVSAGNNDGDAEGSGGNRNESKAFIMRYSDSGKLLWKEFAGGNMDTFVGVAEGTDGSIYALGNFYSGKMFSALGKCDSGVVKYSSDGVMMKKTSRKSMVKNSMRPRQRLLMRQ